MKRGHGVGERLWRLSSENGLRIRCGRLRRGTKASELPGNFKCRRHNVQLPHTGMGRYQKGSVFARFDVLAVVAGI
jgi:hypothetical protein